MYSFRYIETGPRKLNAENHANDWHEEVNMNFLKVPVFDLYNSLSLGFLAHTVRLIYHPDRWPWFSWKSQNKSFKNLIILATTSLLTGSPSLSWQPTTMGFLSAVDCIRGFFLSLSAIERSRVAPKTATALVIAVLTSTILAISFYRGEV